MNLKEKETSIWGKWREQRRKRLSCCRCTTCLATSLTLNWFGFQSSNSHFSILSLWISFSGKDKKIRENLEWVHRSPYPQWCHVNTKQKVCLVPPLWHFQNLIPLIFFSFLENLKLYYTLFSIICKTKNIVFKLF